MKHGRIFALALLGGVLVTFFVVTIWVGWNKSPQLTDGDGGETEETLADLIQALEEDDGEVSWKAVIALRQLGPRAESAVPALIDLYGRIDPAETQKSVDIANTLTMIGDSAAPALIKALGDERTWRLASHTLKQIGEPAGPALIEALKVDDVKIKIKVLRVLSSLPFQIFTRNAAISALTEVLTDKHPDVRLEAAEALRLTVYADARFQSAVPALRKALEDEVPEVRASAASALANLSPEGSRAAQQTTDELLRTLIQALKDTDKEVREKAAGALGGLGSAAGEAVPGLIEYLREDPEGKSASWALSQIGQPAVPGLVEALKDGNPKVRYFAAFTLQNSNIREATAAISALIGAFKDENPQVRFRVCNALNVLDNEFDAALPVFIDALKDKDLQVRRYAAAILRRRIESYDKAAITALTLALQDEDVEVRSSAQAAIDRIDSSAGPLPAGIESSQEKHSTITDTTDSIVVPLPNLPTGAIPMRLTRISPGSFMMGSASGQDKEKPVHEVRIEKPFLIGMYEVTQAQWESVMGSNPSEFKDPNKPVENVSWDDCQRFIAELNQKINGGGFRMPTEAEWEYTCRAGSTTTFCCGDDETCLREYAWSGGPMPVGELRPNNWGLYDMHGNVVEWCQDYFQDNFYSTPEATTPDPVCNNPESLCKVLRGGQAGSAFRGRLGPHNRESVIGFRVVQQLEEVASPLGSSTEGEDGDLDRTPNSQSSDQPATASEENGPFVPDRAFSSSNQIISTPSKTITIDIPDLPPGAQTLTLVRIPPGVFQMGSPESEIGRTEEEGPVHTVTLEQEFYMGKTEITQGQWKALMGEQEIPDWGLGVNYPMYYVSWEMIAGSEGFIAKLNALNQGTFRLPSEAEWEYACRAGTQSRFFFGDSLDCDKSEDCSGGTLPGTRTDYMWFKWDTSVVNRVLSKKEFTDNAQEVAQLRPNQFGLYDISGNVWEWVQDSWHPTYDGAPTDGSPWVEEQEVGRVFRGGRWRNSADGCRSSSRGGSESWMMGKGGGFRIVMDVSHSKLTE